MTHHVAIIGAGIGGLAAALDLVAHGVRVTLVEHAGAPGGKMREVAVGGALIDGGPTVLTMRWVFDDLFEAAGAALSDHLTLHPADILARHAWTDGSRLDLFADLDRSADAIGRFAGSAEAAGFRDFTRRSRDVYQTLEGSFIRAARPSPLSLVLGSGLRGLSGLLRISPFDTLWSALSQHFRDPRLRQLFGRYATYCGSSPFLAPATLMLVAHVEREGVWLVEGGMHRLAAALADLAAARGADIRYQATATEILVRNGQAAGVRLGAAESIEADAVVVNADAGSLAAGMFGSAAVGAAEPVAPAERSLSAMTWAMLAETNGFPLARHTVFFSDDYPAEFTDLFGRRVVPGQPTVYICAQDRDDRGAGVVAGPERLLCLINAPPNGDQHTYDPSEIETCHSRMTAVLQRCGLTLLRADQTTVATTPTDFAQMFPATGGALYGRAVHGPMATFRRPASRTKLPLLYLAGGSTHPGAGVPMAALSGRLAAASVLQDLVSTGRSRRAATPGGMSMR